jgi:hypothetical protein
MARKLLNVLNIMIIKICITIINIIIIIILVSWQINKVTGNWLNDRGSILSRDKIYIFDTASRQFLATMKSHVVIGLLTAGA